MDVDETGEAVTDESPDSDSEQAPESWSDDSYSSEYGVRYAREDSFKEELGFAKYMCGDAAKDARRRAEREVDQHCKMLDEVDFTDGDDNDTLKVFFLKARELRDDPWTTRDKRGDKRKVQLLTREMLDCFNAKRDIFWSYLAESINRVERSDLQFICKEGDVVYASKFFCTGRSAMLDAMLGGGMSEAASSVIRVPDIHSQALLAILEFLYTGDVKRYLPTSWRMKFEAVDAAHFFMLKDVAAILGESLLKKIKNAQKAARLLNMAMRFNFVRSGDEHVFLSMLVKLFKWNWMEKDYAPNLSEGSVGFILRHTKQGSIKEKSHRRPSLYEYLRFRGVVMWAIRNSQPEDAENGDELFEDVIPRRRESLYCAGRRAQIGRVDVLWLQGFDTNRTKYKILDVLQSDHGCKEVVMRLLTDIE